MSRLDRSNKKETERTMSDPSPPEGEWDFLSNRLRRSLRIMFRPKSYSHEDDEDDDDEEEDDEEVDEDEDDEAFNKDPRIPQGLEPHCARQYRCIHTFKGSTLEGVQKAPCRGAMPDHVELLVVCKGCTASSSGDGPFRAHCVRCYGAFQTKIPTVVTGRSKHWSLQKNCLQDGDAGDVFKALNYVDWKTLSKCKMVGDLKEEIPLVKHLATGLTKPDLQKVRDSVRKALSFHPKSEFSKLFPPKKERVVNDTGRSPNRQQLFGMWQLGACPSCCQFVFPPPRPLDIVVPSPEVRTIVIPPTDVPILVVPPGVKPSIVASSTPALGTETRTKEKKTKKKMTPKIEPTTTTTVPTTTTTTKSTSTPTPTLEAPTTRAFELQRVPLETLSGKEGNVLVLETVVSRAISEEEAEKFKGRFQEDIGNIGIRIVQEDPEYRRMVKTSPTDTSPHKYDAVFSLIRTKETDEEGSDLVSLKMLQVVHNFLRRKFGSGPEASKKAQRFMYLFFGIWRRCGWYLAKSTEETSLGNETATAPMDSTKRVGERKTRGTKRKTPPTARKRKVNKGMRSLRAAAKAIGLRLVSQRSDRRNGANGHAGGLTLKDVRVAAASEYLAGGVPRNNLSSTIVIPEIDEAVGCRIARVFYIGAKGTDKSVSACANPNSAIPRFGFKVKSDSSTYFSKLESAIADTAADDTEKSDLHEFFELVSASMEDASTVLKRYNEASGSNLCQYALGLEKTAREGVPGESALERLARRNVVSASGAANGGHRDNYGGQSNKTNERLEMKITCPAPDNGSYKFPGSDGIFNKNWVDFSMKLADWTDEAGAKHGGAPPGCLVYPELLLATICHWNDGFEFHVLHRLVHCSARVGVPEGYLTASCEPEEPEKLRKALLECSRGVWGLDDDSTPRFYPYGGVVTTYRKLI